MRPCPSCGIEQPEWAVQCPNCGANLPPVTTQASAPPGWGAPPPNAPPPNAPPPGSGWSPPPPPGNYPPTGGWSPPGYAAPSPGGPAYGGYAGGPPAANYAGWWYRVGATVIDIIILSVVNGVIRVILSYAAAAPIGIIIDLAYAGWLLSARGQTVGMMAVGTKIADANTGAGITFWRGVGRAAIAGVLWVLLVIPGLVDILMPLWDGRRQTIHDKAVNTVVIMAR